MNDIVLVVILFIFAIMIWLFLPQLFIRRAMTSVIRIFQEHNAVGIHSAKTADELGFHSKGMLDKMFKPRDYKPRALDMLISSNIVQMTEDGKLYLVEERLRDLK